MSNNASNERHYYPEWLRIGYAIPIYILGMSVCAAGLYKGLTGSNTNELLKSFHINTEMTNKATNKLDANSPAKNLFLGSILTLIGSEICSRKERRKPPTL